MFANQATIKFKTTPLAITEEAKKAAKEALCPPSPLKTGEDDIFDNGSYLSLQEQIEKVSDFKSSYPDLLNISNYKL